MRHRYLRPSLSLPEIYLYRAPVDFRKQAQCLAVLVEQELGHNPFTGALYAFTNRQRNKYSITRRWPRRSSSGLRPQMS
jgi:transposase